MPLDSTSDGLGHGSVFSLTLPITNPKEKDKVGNQQDGINAAESLDIVLINDNADSITALKSLLEPDGHRVRIEFGETAGYGCAAKDYQILSEKYGQCWFLILKNLSFASFAYSSNRMSKRLGQGLCNCNLC